MLWRALRGIPDGRYVEVGANDPAHLSITKAFYDRGWHGLTVEPDPEFAGRHRETRPRDTMAELAVTTEPGPLVFHVVTGTGLSTLDSEVSRRHTSAGWETRDIEVQASRLDDLVRRHGYDKGPVHFLIVDVEGAEEQVLRSADFTIFRPWVLVVEATAPLSADTTHDSWEAILLDADYRFCLFDGVSRFYVAAEHAELAPDLSYPACGLDTFTDSHVAELADQTESLRAEANSQREAALARRAETIRWRHTALVTWANAATASVNDHHESVRIAHERALAAVTEVEAMQRTVSWRVTKPLRAVRRLGQGRR